MRKLMIISAVLLAGVACGIAFTGLCVQRARERRDTADYIPLTPERLAMFVEADRQAQARGAWL
jgi:hypothetical protein